MRRKPGEDHGHKDADANRGHRQHVESHSCSRITEGKPGPSCNPMAEDEHDQAEIPGEPQDRGVDSLAEMAEHDPGEDHARRAQRDAAVTSLRPGPNRVPGRSAITRRACAID
jgi:hypothetical protein